MLGGPPDAGAVPPDWCERVNLGFSVSGAAAGVSDQVLNQRLTLVVPPAWVTRQVLTHHRPAIRAAAVTIHGHIHRLRLTHLNRRLDHASINTSSHTVNVSIIQRPHRPYHLHVYVNN